MTGPTSARGPVQLAVCPSVGIRAHAPDLSAACGDILLNFHTDSVGEASAPVAQAHALGTPVSGYAVGSMPEYCGDSDVLFPSDVPIADGFAARAQRAGTFERIPLGSPLVTTWEQSAAAHVELYRGLGWPA